MSFKPFFIHFQVPHYLVKKHGKRGFTAYIQPSALPRHVQVQATFCAAEDEFRKSTGRVMAMAAQTEAINTRRLPELLASLSHVAGMSRMAETYHYVLKYVV